MSDFRGGGGGSKMTPKNWIIEGKKIGHHLCMIPNGNIRVKQMLLT